MKKLGEEYIFELKGTESYDEIFSYKQQLLHKKQNIKRIDVSPSAFMNEEFVKMLIEVFNGIKGRILINITETDNRNKGCIFNEDETLFLKESAKLFNENGFNCYLFDQHTNYCYELKSVIKANRKIDEWAEQINSKKVKNRNLSPLEKYLYAYNIISGFIYKEENKDFESSLESRGIVNVLNGDKIVCVGYSNLLVALCKKIGIPCINQFLVGHACCNVYIKDEIYNVDGIYCSDPTIKSNHFALVKHSDYEDLVNAYNGNDEKYEFVRTEVDSDFDTNFENFASNFSSQTQDKTKEYVSFVKTKDIEMDAKTHVTDFSISIDKFDEMFSFYFSNLNLSQQEKLKLLEKYKMEILKIWGFNDLELFNEYLESAIKQIKRTHGEDLPSVILQELVRNVLSKQESIYYIDSKIKELNFDNIPLSTIEKAITNILLSETHKEQAVVEAKNKMLNDIHINQYDFIIDKINKYQNIPGKENILLILKERLNYINEQNEFLNRYINDQD